MYTYTSLSSLVFKNIPNHAILIGFCSYDPCILIHLHAVTVCPSGAQLPTTLPCHVNCCPFRAPHSKNVPPHFVGVANSLFIYRLRNSFGPFRRPFVTTFPCERWCMVYGIGYTYPSRGFQIPRAGRNNKYTNTCSHLGIRWVLL